MYECTFDGRHVGRYYGCNYKKVNKHFRMCPKPTTCTITPINSCYPFAGALIATKYLTNRTEL